MKGKLSYEWLFPTAVYLIKFFYDIFISEAEAEAAVLSRLPYELWLRATSLMQQFRYKLPIRKVAKLSLQFSILVWFYEPSLNQETSLIFLNF